MNLKKKDFIEVEFTGRVKDGEIFDSNIKEDLKEMNSNLEAKPLIFSLGDGMFLNGVDDFLIGKDIGEYEVELIPEKAFGNRNPKLIHVVPMKVFREQNLNPVQGVMFNFDGRMAKVISVSGGRVIADFNNPIAGKTVIYKIKVLKKIDDLNEKIKAVIDFLFKTDLKFEVKEKKIIIHVEKKMAKFIELFKEKFKEILDLDLEVKEVEVETKEDKKENF